MFKISNLIRQQKTIRHKFIINRKKSLKPANNYTKDVFLCKMVHKRISIKNAFPHFNNIEIMISKSHSIPENSTISWLICLSISILSYYILDSIKFTSAMASINYNLRSSQYGLLPSIHQMIRMNAILLFRCLKSLLIIYIICFTLISLNLII